MARGVPVFLLLMPDEYEESLGGMMKVFRTVAARVRNRLLFAYGFKDTEPWPQFAQSLGIPRDATGKPVVGGLFAVPHKPDADRHSVEHQLPARLTPHRVQLFLESHGCADILNDFSDSLDDMFRGVMPLRLQRHFPPRVVVWAQLRHHHEPREALQAPPSVLFAL